MTNGSSGTTIIDEDTDNGNELTGDEVDSKGNKKDATGQEFLLKNFSPLLSIIVVAIVIVIILLVIVIIRNRKKLEMLNE